MEASHTTDFPRPLLKVRATINLPELPCGTEAFVDARSKYVADCLRAGYLVPVSGLDLEASEAAGET